MIHRISPPLQRYNYIEWSITEQYREIAFSLGLSESAFNILYAINQEGDGCPQSAVYKNSGMSRKTAGSSLQKLQDDGILHIEKGPQRGNRVYLTDKGRQLIAERIAPIVDAENSVFASWSQEELDLYMRLSNRYLKDITEKFHEIQAALPAQKK